VSIPIATKVLESARFTSYVELPLGEFSVRDDGYQLQDIHDSGPRWTCNA